jgi:predicted RNase H-like HicB family nuclease
MGTPIQVRVTRGEHQWVAECPDPIVVTQAPTLDELVVNIREAVGLALEGESLADSNPALWATIELGPITQS